MPHAPEDNRKVLVARSDGTVSIIALQGANPPKITDGFSGWEIIERPHRVGLTNYKGRNPFSMQINLMLDGYVNRISQEHDLRKLTWMALPPQGERIPSPVIVMGSLPFPSGGLWVIQNIDYGDNVIWEEIQGVSSRLRQDLTLTIMQYVRPDLADFTDPGEGLAPKTPTTHIVKKGDTLRRLASYYYGDYTR